MATSLYEKLEKFCHTGWIGKRHVYVTPEQGWLIGTYDNLKEIAPKLRNSPELLAGLSSLKISFGGRKTDTMPSGPRVKSFRKQIKGKLPETNDRRITEQYKKAKNYFTQTTLEAHHIVEKDILKKLELDKHDLTFSNAPCVLIVAELHRRLFTPEGKKHREDIVSKNQLKDIREELDKAYTSLYADERMKELKEVAQIIINSL